MRRLLVSTALLMLCGCATMSKEACLRGDWAGQGFQDGEAGFPQSRIDAHTKACAKTGVTPDTRLYFAAREDGLKRYCTPGRGFHEGRNGHGYANVCPQTLERRFLTGYADGQLVHAAYQRMNQAASDLSSADARAERAEKDVRGVEEELRNPKLNDEQKRELRDRLNRLRAERSRAVEDGRRADWARREGERETAEMRARFTPVYGPW